MDNTQFPAIQIQIRHHRQTLDIRAQDRIVQTVLFSEAWTLATREQRIELLEYVDQFKYIKVKNWISKIMIGTLDRCNMITLRRLARYHRIPNYSRLSKPRLLDELGVKNGSKNINRNNS